MKRKFDDMDLGLMPNGPVPTMSYERSRPQTPATTPGPANMPSTEAPAMPAPGSTTPGQHIRDTFMTGMPSRNATRPPTPFNPALSVPATPPDLYLVTRSSPPISQSLWENFQPNQLFPDDSGLSYFSPPPPGLSPLDPQLQQQGMGSGMMGDGHTMQPGMMHQGSPGMQPKHQWPGNAGFEPGMQGAQDMHGGMPAGSSPDDTWSNSSKGGVVPTTLNVEDWFVNP